MTKQSKRVRHAKRAILYRIKLKAKKKIVAQNQLRKNQEIISAFITENRLSRFTIIIRKLKPVLFLIGFFILIWFVVSFLTTPDPASVRDQEADKKFILEVTKNSNAQLEQQYHEDKVYNDCIRGGLENDKDKTVEQIYNECFQRIRISPYLPSSKQSPSQN